MSDKSTIPILPPVAGEASRVVSSQHPQSGGVSVCCLKVKVPIHLIARLEELSIIAMRDAKLMQDRTKSSSKHWPGLPCVVSKSLITKYQRHKVQGKKFLCPSCLHKDHRDANAAFVIAKRGLACIGGLAEDSVRPRCGLSDGPPSGKGAALCG